MPHVVFSKVFQQKNQSGMPRATSTMRILAYVFAVIVYLPPIG
jgi:hypothetical protein